MVKLILNILLCFAMAGLLPEYGGASDIDFSNQTSENQRPVQRPLDLKSLEFEFTTSPESLNVIEFNGEDVSSSLWPKVSEATGFLTTLIFAIGFGLVALTFILGMGFVIAGACLLLLLALGLTVAPLILPWALVLLFAFLLARFLRRQNEVNK